MLRSALLAVTLALVAAVAAAQGTVKIAILGPMAFVQGENHWAGAEMARRRDQQGGRPSTSAVGACRSTDPGRHHEIQSVPDATNAIERVITRDQADFLIGGFRSEAVLAMQEVRWTTRRSSSARAPRTPSSVSTSSELRALQVLVRASPPVKSRTWRERLFAG